MSAAGAAAGAALGTGIGALVGGRYSRFVGAIIGALVGHLMTPSDDGDLPGDVGADMGPTAANESIQSFDGTVNTTTDPLLSTLEPVTAQLMANFLAAARAQGFNVFIESGGRSFQKQLQLYEDYKAGRSPYPASDPRTDPGSHLYLAAADLGFRDVNGEPIKSTDVPDARWKALADLAQSMGLKAGYYFSRSDRVHFERPDWRSLRATETLS